MVEVSVVVVTYNSDLSKLFLTLKSIIKQKNITFEIIIADDGSEKFDRNIIEKWFALFGFDNYIIVSNKTNQGTLKNALSGLALANGVYVKQLSPGDCLYDEDTLSRFVLELKRKNISLGFGKVAGYKNDCQGGIILQSVYAPIDLNPYIDDDLDKIKRNYFYFRDYINGMSFIGKKDIVFSYMAKLSGKVKYAEDCTYAYIIAAGYKILFLDTYIIWYECGTGISTSKSSVWGKRIYNDNAECFKIIASEFSEWKIAHYLNFVKSPFFYLHKIIRNIYFKRKCKGYTGEPDREHILTLINERS